MAEPKWTFGTDSSATVVPIGALRWYRFERYDGTDSSAAVVPIQALRWYRFADIINIYLYAEEPEKIEFDVYGKLDNMNDIVLHVPCFCAKKYRDYEEEYCSMYDYNDKKYVKVWREFKRIEEFDPIDMFGEWSYNWCEWEGDKLTFRYIRTIFVLNCHPRD